MALSVVKVRRPGKSLGSQIKCFQLKNLYMHKVAYYGMLRKTKVDKDEMGVVKKIKKEGGLMVICSFAYEIHF